MIWGQSRTNYWTTLSVSLQADSKTPNSPLQAWSAWSSYRVSWICHPGKAIPATCKEFPAARTVWYFSSDLSKEKEKFSRTKIWQTMKKAISLCEMHNLVHLRGWRSFFQTSQLASLLFDCFRRVTHCWSVFDLWNTSVPFWHLLPRKRVIVQLLRRHWHFRFILPRPYMQQFVFGRWGWSFKKIFCGICQRYAIECLKSP